MNYSSEKIGKVIRLERSKLHFSQETLGSKIGVKGKQISNYESGITTPPIDILFALCKVFNCELGYLLCEETYSSGTQINTYIEQSLGINSSSIESIRHITGNNKDCLSFGYHSSEYRKIINKMFSSSMFSSLFESLHDWDQCYSQKNTIFEDLEVKYGSEVFSKAFEYYQSTTDYLRDENAEKLPEIYYEAMVDIDSAIDEIVEEDQRLSYNRKIVQFDLYEKFRALFEDMYPSK